MNNTVHQTIVEIAKIDSRLLFAQCVKILVNTRSTNNIFIGTRTKLNTYKKYLFIICIITAINTFTNEPLL